ncbi:cytochrome oxidase [Escherichia coli]|uniref:Cytochrome oxidase n=1 Tax=Escherichia coli TaxID=562 RepID=A0A377BB60_ECOLX|nr:cytochrome oxidase [Escherichia coli]
MVWTVRWRGAESLPTRAAFLIFLSIFSFTRWCRLALFLLHRSKMRWQAAGCCLRLSARAAVFLAFAALAAKHQIDNPGYAHKSFYYLGGLTEGTETILLFVLGCLFPAWFAWFAWIFGALCWDDDLYAGVEWVSDAEVAPASVIAMLFATVRAAFTGCYRIFWIAAPFVPAAVIHGNILPTHGACVHKVSDARQPVPQ